MSVECYKQFSTASFALTMILHVPRSYPHPCSGCACKILIYVSSDYHKLNFPRIIVVVLLLLNLFPLLETMAQSKSFFDDVKKEIECSLCEEQFSEIKEPKILNCFHTFCKPCLKEWLQKNREGVLSCPNRCHKITECPENNVERLQPNFFLKQIVEIVEAYSGQEDSPRCKNRDERRPLKYYCSDCNCFLCEDS